MSSLHWAAHVEFTIILLFVPPKFYTSIVFNFSWDIRQIENNAYAKLWRDKKEYGKFENSY